MPQSIAVVNASSEERRKLCAALKDCHFRPISLNSLGGLIKAVRKSPCHSVILDLDSLPVDNSFIQELLGLNPSVCMIGISSRTFHPELEEAIRNHISACLSKPVNMKELIYWLKSVCEAGPSSRASPEQREE